jgi:hypothetical protein
VRRRHLDAVFPFLLLNETLLTLPFSIHSLKSVRDYSNFSVHRNFKASPSARYISSEAEEIYLAEGL